MIQGTDEVAAWNICENGFGTVASLDAGWYGQGLNLIFKFQYSKETTK